MSFSSTRGSTFFWVRDWKTTLGTQRHHFSNRQSPIGHHWFIFFGHGGLCDSLFEARRAAQPNQAANRLFGQRNGQPLRRGDGFIGIVFTLATRSIRGQDQFLTKVYGTNAIYETDSWSDRHKAEAGGQGERKSKKREGGRIITNKKYGRIRLSSETNKEATMNQKKRTPARWEEQANKAAKVYEIPAAELKREIKR